MLCVFFVVIDIDVEVLEFCGFNLFCMLYGVVEIVVVVVNDCVIGGKMR